MEFTLGNFEQLQDDLKEAQQERDDQRRVLERAIDRLAQIGIITDTPYCKQLYIDGKREL